MPELPEVETIRRGLNPKIKGRKIIKIKVLRDKVLLGISAKKFTQELKGDTFLAARRRGKFLILDLKSKRSLLIHLRMTGQLIYEKKPTQRTFDRILFYLDNGDILHYADARLFGKIKIVKTEDIPNLKEIKALGPEPLLKNFSLNYFKKILSKRKRLIKSLLLDQTLIAGIGNIYDCEALFMAGIDPCRRADSLTLVEIEKLFRAIKAVIKKGVALGGTSVDQYLNANGREGKFQYELKVYDRKGEKCLKPRCQGTIKRIVVAQRGTYYCPQCQK